MNKKEVGQILYILSNSDMNLIPVLIVEETIRRTIEGEVVTYTVESMGKNGARKSFTLPREGMVVFDDVGNAREFLIKNATDAINSLCADAESRGQMLVEPKKKRVEEIPVHEYEDVLLDDGTMIKMKINY